MKHRLLALLALLCIPSVTPAEPVSMEAPAIYAEQIAPLLSSTDDLIARPPRVAHEGEDGVILLHEDIQFLEENGHHWHIVHLLEKAVTESGAEELARHVSGFRKSSQRVHLVLAQTIQPDGKKLTVKPEAAFLQTPQRDAEDALYDDQSELVVVFPNVKPGCLTESIIVVEEENLRIPGHLTAGFAFTGGWPVEHRRCVLELPETWAGKVHLTTVGNGVPDAERLQIGKRSRWIWERRNMPVVQREPQRATIWNTGPYLWINTLKDWDEFLAWYLPKIEETSRVGESLKAAVEECLKGVTDRTEIINRLAARVANDLRYVGLEFGRCDLEPHDVNAIWEHQYGDCKDKASLLCAMLALKGIRAYPALINTIHTGTIEKRTADYRQFNHVIVAIENNGWLFCDPTIPNGPPGVLAPADGDRDVLLVKTGETWVHTPPQTMGTRKFHFDAKMAAAGEISGWLTFEATGYLGAMYGQMEARGTKQSLRDRLTLMLEGAWEGARVVDVKQQDHPDKQAAHYRVQAYFVVPANDAASLTFPFGAGLLPDLRVDRPRETDYPLRIEELEVDGTFELPPGLAAGRQPAALKLESRFAQSRAHWEPREGNVLISFHFHTRESRVPAGDCAALASLLGAVKNWLGKPLVLQPSDSSKPPVENAQTSLPGDFPQMPSAEGQLALVEERFPMTGNAPMRRAALEKTIAYFPQDPVTRFNAGTQIAWLDVRESKSAEAIKRLTELLRAYRGNVSVEDAALGEYVLGLAYDAQGADKEFFETFNRMAGDTQLSAGRRAWAWYRLAVKLSASDPAKAIESARAGLALQGGNEPLLLVLLARTLLETGHIEELKPDLELLKGRSAALFSESIVALGQLVRESAPVKHSQATSLVDLLETMVPKELADEETRAALADCRRELARVNSWGAIRERLQTFVKEKLPKELDAFTGPIIGKKREEIQKAIEAATKEGGKNGANKAISYTLFLLTTFEPDADFSEHLWKAASHAAWKEQLEKAPAMTPLLRELLALCALTAPDDEANIEGAFVEATVLKRYNDLKAVAGILTELSERKSLPETYRVPALEQLAQNALDRHDYEKAIEVCKQIEAFLDYPSVADSLLGAVFINLARGNQEEALRLLELVRAMPESKWQKSDAHEQIGDLLALTEDPAKARAWWKASAQWWPAWMTLENKLGVPLTEGELVVPVIPSLAALGEKLFNAVRANDLPERLRILRLMAHAGRWDPKMAVELQLLGFSLAPLKMINLMAEFRRFAISLHENFVSEDPELRHKEALWATIAYFDTANLDSAQKVIDDFLQSPYQEDPISFGMARLACVTAVKSGKKMSEAAAFAEKTLQSSDYHELRSAGVLVLAELYSKMGRKEAEIALLERELDNADIKEVPAQVTGLKERLASLTRGSSLNESLTLAIKEWTDAAQLPWLQFARPHSLDDPIIGNLDEPQESNTLSIAERFRGCY